MKRDIPLTEEQQLLVKTHLYIVTLVITESIHVNKSIYGFEYEDLYQEGCIWLCHAAATYNWYYVKKKYKLNVDFLSNQWNPIPPFSAIMSSKSSNSVTISSRNS